VPTLSDKQGGQLLVVALLVLGRTWVSDRIADLNGLFSLALPFDNHFQVLWDAFDMHVKLWVYANLYLYLYEGVWCFV
jgi:hypothetical protein